MKNSIYTFNIDLLMNVNGIDINSSIFDWDSFNKALHDFVNNNKDDEGHLCAAGYKESDSDGVFDKEISEKVKSHYITDIDFKNYTMTVNLADTSKGQTTKGALLIGARFYPSFVGTYEEKEIDGKVKKFITEIKTINIAGI